MSDPAKYDYAGSAYGSDPATHRVIDGEFVCSAPGDAKCRTSPTCECEVWCCDDPEDHDEGDHCCMTTVKPGQGCWMAGRIDAQGVEDSHGEEHRYDDNGVAILHNGAVVLDWDDSVFWSYASLTGDSR